MTQEQKQTTVVVQTGMQKSNLPLDKKEGAQATQKSKTFPDLLKSMENEIKRALPKHITVERMLRIAQTAYSRNLGLQKCDPMTIIAAIVQSAQMGLEINTPLGEAYIIPRYNSKTKQQEAQFQTGYKGELSLAYRTGQYRMIGAYEVYKNDEFSYEYGLDRYCKHKPAKKPDGNPIYYYAVYETINGGKDFKVMSFEQVEDHSKKHSQAVQSGWTSPWKTDFNAMAKKTVLKSLLSYAPKSIEYATHFSQDGSIKREIDSDMSTIPNEIDIDFEITGLEAVEETGQKK